MEIPPGIKVCGITRVEDALAVAMSGVDALGLVFYEKSKRHVTPEQAQEIARAVPPFVSLVGLFVDASEAFIESVLEKVPLSLLQFHGKESEAQCNLWGMRYIKAISMKSGVAVQEIAAQYTSASGYLLDTYSPAMPGGSGEAFDWKLVPGNLDRPLILAGGLDETNVAQAIAKVKPYAVDVSSGVEQQPGIKDKEKVKAFVKAVGCFGNT